MVFWNNQDLRAVVCKYRESRVRSKNSHLFLLHQKNLFGKLCSKTIFKSSSEVPFLRKVGKLKIVFNLVKGPMEIMQIRAFSKHSYERTKANLQFIFTGFVAQFSKFLSSYILSLFRLSLYFLHPYRESNVLCFDDTVNFTIFLTRMTEMTGQLRWPGTMGWQKWLGWLKWKGRLGLLAWLG